MLEKENRLLSNYEFSKTHFKGRRIKTPFFYLYFLKQEGPTKVGIVVSTKFSKKAVVRNRVKRVFREIIRQNFGKIKPGFWVVLHPSKKSLKVSYEELNIEFNKILQKAPFLREP